MALDTATNSFYKPADKRGTKESVQYAKDDTPLRQPVTGEMPSGTLTTVASSETDSELSPSGSSISSSKSSSGNMEVTNATCPSR